SIQPITKTIGINKLGTLLSSQTTDTFEYSRKQFNSMNFYFVFLRCDVSILFHSFSLCKSGCFPGIHSAERIRPSKTGAISSVSASAHREVASLFGGGWSLFFRFSGGDSENITRSPAAVQIGCGGACRGSSRGG
ncbi:hypothetical protein PV768_08935, partial [Pseudarthrobacter sp. CC4]|uniref:hypothetical protein n=1 Tax=Pseudarthrobacter sp. CC4 TaxID=3029190 RepID=UPI003B8D6F01